MVHSRGLGRSSGPVLRLAAASVVTVLTACGGNGYGSAANNGPPLMPTVNVSVSPTTINAGQSATVTWSTTNAQTCTASGGWSGTPATSGTQTVTPTATGTVMFTLACTAPSGMGYAGGGGGSATGSASLTVTPQTQFVAKNLVTDTAGGGGATVDPNLVNPWGIVFGAGKPVWTSNNHSQTSTLYDGNGVRTPAANPLVVQLPPDATNNDFDPTGIVYNSSTTDFAVTAGGKTGVALFIFDGEDGMIGGWAPAVSTAVVAIAYTATDGASYKGLAIANNGTANFLYAADFANNKVDMFDKTFTKQPANGRFVDPTLPAGYAPFGIQAIANGPGGAAQIYVTYAKQGTGGDNASGAGLGLVDIYDANGTFVKHLIPTGGWLNAPWGLALAPASWGTLSNALLVGNFGDGKINAFDPATGVFLGTLTTASGPFQSPGLWGIAFGNGAANQPTNTLYFAAGPNDEANGVYGRVDLPPM